MKYLKTIVLICVAVCLFSSCKKELDMTLLKSTLMDGASVSSIQAKEAFEVKVVKDESTFVEMECSAYLNDYIICQVENGCLTLSVDKVGLLPNGTEYRAVVHTPTLQSIALTDASRMTIVGDFEDFTSVDLDKSSVCSGGVFSGNGVEITLDDASQLVDFTFDGQQLNAKLSDASHFVGYANVIDELNVELTAASNFINYGGNTQNAKLDLKEASLLNMAQTEIRNIEVDFSGKSTATVKATETISGRLTDVSTLYYYGNPQLDVECLDGSFVQRL